MNKRINDIFNNNKSISRSITAMLVLVLSISGCNQSDWSPYVSNATISQKIIASGETTISGTTSGDPAYIWILTVNQGSEFCSTPQMAGRVGAEFYLKFSENDGDTSRKAIVTIAYVNNKNKQMYSNSFEIVQMSATENPDYDHTWGEQPHYKFGESLVYKTYYTTNSMGKRVRNYSVCYDTQKLVSQWVAYPVHSMYTQRGTYTAKNSNGRTDAWAFDDAVCEYQSSYPYYKILRYDITLPAIPQSKQQNIVEGSYGTGDNRGHMLPSATRYMTYNTNAQTFYPTNMMPQNGNFNSNSWAALEGKVRDWGCSDTLYVVTGTLYESGTRKITSRGRTITRPSHAYKLVLRTKSGRTGKYIGDITSAGDLKCIAFVYENETSSAYTSPKNAAVPVSEIERRSGFKFFRNLDKSIAEAVKNQCNTSDWGI